MIIKPRLCTDSFSEQFLFQNMNLCFVDMSLERNTRHYVPEKFRDSPPRQENIDIFWPEGKLAQFAKKGNPVESKNKSRNQTPYPSASGVRVFLASARMRPWLVGWQFVHNHPTWFWRLEIKSKMVFQKKIKQLLEKLGDFVSVSTCFQKAVFYTAVCPEAFSCGRSRKPRQCKKNSKNIGLASYSGILGK